MEFEAPLVTGPELPAQRQSVVFEEDVIQFSTAMDYSLRPGDKVLAPWGPDQQCYGPGTVLLGLEARDPQRGKGAALGHPGARLVIRLRKEQSGYLDSLGVLGA